MVHNHLISCVKCNTVNHFESKRKRKWTKKKDDKPCATCNYSVWGSYKFWLEYYNSEQVLA